MNNFREMLLRAVFGTTLLFSVVGFDIATTTAQEQSSLFDYVGAEEPPAFDDPNQAVTSFKKELADNDFEGVARLLGLDAAKLKSAEGVMATYEKIRQGTAKKVEVQEFPDRWLLTIGDELWPLPFPITKGDKGQWAFDTYAGIEEIINRRIGENEIEAIATARAYVDAQNEYALEDRDEDGVPEYAQKLVSSEGKTDGLFWPAQEGQGDSPAGPFVNEAALEKAKKGSGYFGYRFRILTGQGDNIAGGKYDYVINGNMIAGFALIAWPVKYAETGVRTFVVNHYGVVYEADLGDDTESLVKAIKRFNPDKTWDVTAE